MSGKIDLLLQEHYNFCHVCYILTIEMLPSYMAKYPRESAPAGTAGIPSVFILTTNDDRTTL